MQATFDRALASLQDGETQTTVELCLKELSDRPQNGKMRVLLGTALVRQHEFAAAEEELRQVIATWPDIPKAHRELGNALFGQGRGEEAIQCYERIVQLTPDKSVAHFDLSMALSKLGREQEAQQALEESFRLDPDRKELLTAAQHQRVGHFAKAEEIYRDVLRRDPTNVSATRLLGSVATEMGRYKLAERLLRNAVKLAPGFFGAWADLARTLIEKEEFDEGHKALEQAIALEPELPYPRMLLGNLLTKAGRYEEAADAFKIALQKQPDHGGSLAGLGHALKTIGRQDEAIQTYRDCIKAYPAFGEAYWSLANLKTFRFSDNEIATMEQYVDNDKLLIESRVNLNFALGKAYEDQDDFERAFSRYDQGNALRRPNESYDPVQTEVIHDRIIETVTPTLLKENENAGDPSTAPIFIVGLPRSGSTLVEQILASHSDVDGTHELPDLPRVIRTINQERPQGDSYPEALLHYGKELARLGQQYLESTRRHRGHNPFFTDKMPNNFASIGLIALTLPNAKIVNARRHPLDSCMGSFKQLFYKGQAFTYDLVELGEYYLEYCRMMDYWHELLPGKVLDVHYEQMVTDQENQTRRLLEHCQLPWQDRCLRFYETERAVNTASSEQVRQPIYSGSIHSWRRFETRLGPLIEVLEPLLRQLPQDQRPTSLQ
jgi:tetratricopeptide (TPR) repeat protein